ncbi:Hypothetical protein CAP_7327 [Chondromyces apiculatus DSM 436]|uniref:YlxR domain-containing protein n=1 Tax=Chondromyces apiculatus DSM 436 TaxID=1192034 RepID=A0A017T067_9BACT|nr:Hypothetical protein CAP_7327 [Chondromyces apiculatus DSM 436]
MRLILGPDGIVAVDPGNGGFGRGAHVHPHPDCLAKAVQRGLSRAARGRVHAIHLDHATDAGETRGESAPERTAPEQGAQPQPVPLTAASLARAIRQAMDRRIRGLIQAAVRSRAAAIGADAAAEALDRGAHLALVACDAAAGAELSQVQTAVAAGRAAAWGTKMDLGKLAGGRREQGVAVMAISSSRLASALLDAVHTADACAAAERGAVVPGRPGGGGTRPPRRPSGREQQEKPATQAEPPRVPGSRQPGVARRDDTRNSLQGKAPRRKHEEGTSGDQEMDAREGAESDAAARRGQRGWARRTGNVERGA